MEGESAAGVEAAEPAPCRVELGLAPIPRESEQPCRCERGACRPSPAEKTHTRLKKNKSGQALATCNLFCYRLTAAVHPGHCAEPAV